MHSYSRVVKMGDTDATGVVYFANIQKIALEAFEDYLFKKGFSLEKMIQEEDYLLPIVHASADYLSPIKAGDEIYVLLHCSHIGTSSFTLKSHIHVLETDVVVATVTIVHVTLDKYINRSTAIPQNFLELLKAI